MAGSPTVAELASRLEQRLPELRERVVRQILEAEPVYVESRVDEGDLNASVQQSLRQFIDKLVDPTAETLGYLTFLTGVGRQRVEQGLPLDSLLHAFRIGARTVWQGLREEAARHDALDTAALVDAASAIWELHEAVSARVANAYRDAELALLRRREQERNSLIDGLLEGRGHEAAFAREAAFALRLRVHSRYVVVVAEAGADGCEPLSGVERLLSRHGFPSVWRVGPPRSIGIVDVGDADEHSIRPLLGSVADTRVGVSTVVGSLRELPGAVQLADTAVLSLPDAGADVALLSQRLPEALLAGSPEVSAILVEQVLGPLARVEPHERDRLTATLTAYSDTGGSINETAAAVYCHRNTVIKRLRRFEHLTGHSLSDPSTRLAVTLALRAAAILKGR